MLSTIRRLGLAPSGSPKARWTPLLITVTAFAALALAADGLVTIWALSDPAHLATRELNPLAAGMLAWGGSPSLMILKMLQILVQIGLIDGMRRLGLPRTALFIAIIGLAFGLGAVLSNLAVLGLPGYPLR